jgi:hypothetical protein
MVMKNQAQIRMSFELLKQQFHIPMETQLVGVRYEVPDELVLIVDHPELKEIKGEGFELPIITPIITGNSWNWNQK